MPNSPTKPAENCRYSHTGDCHARKLALPTGEDANDMIRLTRLNNRPLVVNSDLIKFIENAPDTVITLVSGEKIVVLETAQEVINRIVEYRQQLRRPLTAVVPSLVSAEKSEMPENPMESPEDDE